MLVFASEFPIKFEFDALDIVNAFKVWLIGSKHNQLQESDLNSISLDGPSRIVKGISVVETLILLNENTELVAGRYSHHDSKSQSDWVTEVVYSKQCDSWLSVKLYRYSDIASTKFVNIKKPLIVSQLIDNFGGAKDGPLVVNTKPFFLKNSDITLATELITGVSACRLPVVYLSCNFKNEIDWDAVKLARDLCGLAHVVVEPNRAFSTRLQMEVKSQNVYGGALGIYWPEAAGRRVVYKEPDFVRGENEVFNEIKKALIIRRPLARCTWAYVTEEYSKIAYRRLKDDGSTKLNEFLDLFENELKAKDQQRAYDVQEIERLSQEIRRLEAKSNVSQNGLLALGQERDFYPNEIKCIIISALKNSNLVNDSRRAHVIQDIIEHNKVDDISQKFKDKIKESLRNSNGLDAKIRRELADIGFTISDDGKHHKLLFMGDDRYTFALQKTGSDFRGGLNAAGDICRLLF